MTACFADTFCFLAMMNPRDEDHERVTAFMSAFVRPLVTTAWVLTEVGDALADTPNRPIFTRFLSQLRSDSRSLVVPTSDNLFEEGVELYHERPDKEWSLTDCISFVVMQQQGLSEALTKDHHFEQAGFVALLK